MDQKDILVLFVSNFCSQLAKMDRPTWEMSSFYLFSDKRPGGIIERFEADAKREWDYQKMYRL
jgi:hypothetical protein